MLSSHITFAQKIVMPAILTLAISSGIIVAAFLGRIGSSLLGVVLLLFCQFIFSCIAYPLKQVYADENAIKVSNYRRSVEIPYSEIESIKTTWLNIPLISIALSKPSLFGKSILIIPKGIFVIPFLSPHPVEVFLTAKVHEIQARNGNDT